MVVVRYWSISSEW